MITFSHVAGVAILAAAIYIVYKFLTVREKNRKHGEEHLEKIRPLSEKLDRGQELTQDDVRPYAANLLTREATFQLLKDYDKADLFPAEFYTIEKGAESNLANWLEFPTELDGCPDEIELVKRVTIDFEGNNVYYYVFKYRMPESHRAAKNGWMLGVVGPYFDDSKPYDTPDSTFSRQSSKFETTSPEEEAKWVHEHISMR